MNMLIGFTGPMGCGKSYAAKYLRDRHRFQIHKMAGPLKQMMRTLGLGLGAIEGSQKELPHDLLCGKSPRYAMQTLGTEWGRQLIGEDFWVNLWAFQRPGGRVVCDDVRFANEAAIIQKLGGTLIAINRDRLIPRAVPIRRDGEVSGDAFVPMPHEHGSEKFDGINADLILYNDGTDRFMDSLDYMIGQMLKKQTNAD